MNMKQVEQLLEDIKRCDDQNDLLGSLIADRLDPAIKFLKRRQRAIQRRKAHFRFLADEQREMLK